MTDAATPTSSTTPASPAKNEDTYMKTAPTMRACTQEEFDQVVVSLTKDLKPYQVDLWNKLKEFNLDDSKTSLDFPPTLTNFERQTVHQLADIFGMSHESYGKGQKRFIKCEKKAVVNKGTTAFTEQFFFKGYLGLMGPCVDSFAHQAIQHIPSTYIEPRVRRDGPKHHITIVAKKELQAKYAVKEGEDFDEATVAKLLAKMSEEVKDDWEDMGLGKTSVEINGELNEAFYKIIHWDSANKFRKELGLPEKHFHITIGYKTDDIHDVTKDVTTLVALLEKSTLETKVE